MWPSGTCVEYRHTMHVTLPRRKSVAAEITARPERTVLKWMAVELDGQSRNAVKG